ncbi:Uncharacterised protein [Salmonella enterica subsp. enterica serovar Bovismorbificans]|nr:Uncharacterised protein [Salmonella enterica subsp. enterica serovar Bovismorbificans]CPR49673.1 Uncharacterised protein [Salmonella enterica subsp. enterica serovar Bovismorbificans]
MINDSFDSPAALFQRFAVGVVAQRFRPRRTEEVIGHQVDAIQAGSHQIFYFRIVKNSSDSRSGNRDLHIAQTRGIQLFTQFGNQQRVVSAIFRTKRVARPFIVRVFPVNIHFAEHRELFEQFHHAFGEDFTRRVRSGGFVEPVTHAPAADTHGERQRVTCGFRFCLHITQRAQQTLGVRLSYSLRIHIPAADIKAEVDIRLEVAPWVEEGRLIFHFAAQRCRFCYDIAVFCINFSETGDANKAKNQFVISRR